MRTVRLVGWQEGIKIVSLIQAMRRYSKCSLAEARAAAEDLLAGHHVILEFEMERDRARFRTVAEDLGAVVEEDV